MEGDWVVHHLALHLFRLGRLQFQRSSRPGYAPVAKGEMFLDVHIPEGDPLSPDLCDESFEAAPAFFARYFPEDRPRVFACRPPRYRYAERPCGRRARRHLFLEPIAGAVRQRQSEF